MDSSVMAAMVIIGESIEQEAGELLDAVTRTAEDEAEKRPVAVARQRGDHA